MNLTYHTFGLIIYYDANKPKKEKKTLKWGKNKTQECLNNIHIHFPT